MVGPDVVCAVVMVYPKVEVVACEFLDEFHAEAHVRVFTCVVFVDDVCVALVVSRCGGHMCPGVSGAYVANHVCVVDVPQEFE